MLLSVSRPPRRLTKFAAAVRIRKTPTQPLSHQIQSKSLNAATTLRSVPFHSIHTPSPARTFVTSSTPSLTTSSPLAYYDSAIAAGKLRHDERQRKTVQLLEHTFQELVQAKKNGGKKRQSFHATPVPTSTPSHSSAASSNGFFGFAKRLLNKNQTMGANSSSIATSASSSSSPFYGIKGLYLHGGVGCGKTMLMNQFFDCLTPELVSAKTVRKHFHSFMLDIHRRLHELRRNSPNIQDPISHVARAFVANECEVLCLDEFQVTDVADAMILKQLFDIMWNEGCVMVATSNRPPEELYKNGLNRSVFLPFIDHLKAQCTVHALEEGQDHRLLGTLADGVYHSPCNPTTHAAMDAIFDRLAGSDPSRRGPAVIPVMMGRNMKVPLCDMNSTVAQFSFPQLCETNVGAADYIALVQKYKYILLTDIPIMYFHQREKIRRFITFLDVAYEHHTRLIMQADADPLTLFRAPTTEMVAGVPSDSAEVPMPEFEGIATKDNSQTQAQATPANTTADAATSSTSSSTPAPSSSSSPSSSIPSPVPAKSTLGLTSAATTAGAKYDEQFASSRAISRLIEMSSKEYVQMCAKERD